MATDGPGRRLGPYELVSRIGAGGMGEVWKARDTRLDRIVAIKLCAAQFDERFEREAKAIAALNHPHICQLYDVGPNYLVMEHIDGQPLKGPLPLDKSLLYGAQICEALDAAHRRGVVHRDLKPGNILVSRAGIKLVDFGLAKLQPLHALDTETMTEALTGEGAILGTLQYMSPEQVEGKPADTRCDIFSFGLVLYEMLTGRRAFQAASHASLISAILRDQPPPVSSVVPVAPPAVDRVVNKCLAKDPDGRWQSAADLRDELKWIAENVSEPQTVASPIRPRGYWWVPLLIGMALALAGAALWYVAKNQERPVWSGVLLGGPGVAIGPRVSPDGQLLVFLAMENGLLQLAVMKPDSGSWTLLTHDRQQGFIETTSWARDGTKVYFDRFWDKPRGVYTIPPLGGEARLLLDDAWGPEALPDGSLLVVKDYQIHRFWPDSGRLDPLPAYLDHPTSFASMRAFPDGKEVIFYGAYRDEGNKPPGSHLYILDLATRRARRLAANLNFNFQELGVVSIAVAPDNRSALVVASHQDTRQMIRISRKDGKESHVMSFTSTAPPYFIDEGRDGSIYVDQVSRSFSIVRFAESGENLQERSAPTVGFSAVLPLTDGRVLFHGTDAGRAHLVIGQPGAEPHRFLQTEEENTKPVASVGTTAVAFAIGPPDKRRIAVASLRDGRIVKRFSFDAAHVTALGGSRDGRTLYYAADGAVWSVDMESGNPKRVAEGDDVSLDPAGRFLYIKRIRKDPVQLVRKPVDGGPEETIPVPGGAHLTENADSPTAVDSRGRIVVEIASASSYFYRPAILDPARKTLTPIDLTFEGDVWFPGWAADGRIVAVGSRMSGTLWRYRAVPEQSPSQPQP